MHMVYLHTQDSYTYTFATRSCFDAPSHFGSKGHQRLELLVREVEDIIRLRLCEFRDNECVALYQRVDIEECVVLIILCYFVARDLAFDDFRKDSHGD